MSTASARGCSDPVQSFVFIVIKSLELRSKWSSQGRHWKLQHVRVVDPSARLMMWWAAQFAAKRNGSGAGVFGGRARMVSPKCIHCEKEIFSEEPLREHKQSTGDGRAREQTLSLRMDKFGKLET